MNLAIVSAAVFLCADAGLALGANAPVATAAEVRTGPVGQAPALQPEETVEAAPRPGEAIVSQPEEPLATLVFAQETDEQIVARVVDYLESIDTLQADFVQVAPSGAVSAGRFYLRRPGLLRFEYDPPTPLLIVANGGMVFVRDEALETTDSYPVNRTPLKFLLRRKVEFEDLEIRSVDRGVDTVAVTFASSDEETEGELSLILAAPDLALRQWVVRDPQNGVTVVDLENVTEGVRLANRLFQIPEAGSAFLKD
ncbi:LolA family protein [Amphiplicatus metriothermophilus]|uniref:Outer membrane lipoprotein-sorting protein n=1 Tax=Amphiplicatus metriothermophilus TaxID=1519374 RepID=A0A239PJK0_9PROT|nr:outer membrane lipoprotein carrier protein LolA [Amphiplicatus metriothermophilus]MBB5517684.1 outer membrane lipoprotein-sorting protein [Amphiplicatus metriothermophilus]SNT67982.1 Outer membrane lipoprotein-sorting protein [Amphiplicatus metriothermophilus]